MSRNPFFRSLLAAFTVLTGAASTAACAQDSSAHPAVEEFVEWQAANELPAAFIETTGPAPETRGGNRIGGQVWLPEGTEWPVARDGKPMTFLAQIDFAELPPLPDYPASGVLQFFIGRDDLYGANFEQPEMGDFKVLWHENFTAEGRYETGPQSQQGKYDDFSPLYEAASRRGVGFKAVAAPHRPSIDSWLTERDKDRLPASDDSAAWDAIYEHENAQAGPTDFGVSHIGGHPEFTQSDWRANAPYQDVDRVLLNLWSMDEAGLMWGDSGQGQFTIRREDLLKRDFSKVFYQWDCY
ncbi:YwqG family protein [Erythrobacter sp. HKB08]|uniref:YwqG family protein n=1 Tax=Erythrobacter sp. HKB08 TaxID=2502843 RepID=UPI001008B301|nr:YwqG family protein [Erythrobacter sp. HKB08]